VKIFINQEEISYQLENESHLNELLPIITQYLFEQGERLGSLMLDDRLYTSDLAMQELSSIEALHVSSVPFLELEETIKRSTNLLARVQSGSGCNLQGCADNIEAWAMSVEFWLHNFSLSADFFALLRNLPNYDESEQQQDVYTKSISAAIRCLTEHNTELEQPVNTLLHTMQLLLSKEPIMRGLSGTLQAGQDATAVYEVLFFMESLQTLKRQIALLPVAFEGFLIELDVWYQSVVEQMHPLIEALDHKDFVLAGDLGEYEVAERLSRLQDISTRYQQKVETAS
jgi:hypothetical protein